MSIEIVWQDPPPAKARGMAAKHDAMVAEFRANPGRWAYVGRSSGGHSLDKWKRRGCETRTVSVDGAFDVYVRWPVSS